MIDRTYQNHHSSKGSAEDEPSDGAARFAKIRPMRVEMYGMNWNDSWGKIHNEEIRRDAIHRVSTAPQRAKSIPLHSIHCSGQRGDYLIGNDPHRP